MLLPFRWLLYGAAAATSGTRKNPKIQRKLRRLARWSEAVAPPRRDVVISSSVAAAVSAAPSIASGQLFITRHVAVYSKGVVRAALSLADFIGISVSIETPEVRGQRSEVRVGEIETKIDLWEDEYLALMQLLAS